MYMYIQCTVHTVYSTYSVQYIQCTVHKGYIVYSTYTCTHIQFIHTLHTHVHTYKCTLYTRVRYTHVHTYTCKYILMYIDRYTCSYIHMYHVSYHRKRFGEYCYQYQISVEHIPYIHCIRTCN